MFGMQSCVKQEGLIFKEQQVHALKLLLKARDIFVWFPTGYAKSLCYQLLPFLMDYKLGSSFLLSPCVSHGWSGQESEH